jgi:hypothetical protein
MGHIHAGHVDVDGDVDGDVDVDGDGHRHNVVDIATIRAMRSVARGMLGFVEDCQDAKAVHDGGSFHRGTAGDRVVPGGIGRTVATCGFGDVQRDR